MNGDMNGDINLKTPLFLAIFLNYVTTLNLTN
jgi:hypothetical protein